jgi:cell division protein FtsQ
VKFIRKFFKFRLKKWVKTALILVFLSGVLSFVGQRYEAQTCQKVEIVIDSSDGNSFINSEEIQILLDDSGREYIIGSRYRNINTRVLEQRIKKNIYVQECQIFKNLKGELLVQVLQKCPITRFIGTANNVQNQR